MVIAGILDKIPIQVGRGVEFYERMCYNREVIVALPIDVFCMCVTLTADNSHRFSEMAGS